MPSSDAMERGSAGRALLEPSTPTRSRFGQALAVALGFYCSGHLMDLVATIGRLGLGYEPGGLLPGWAWQQAGMLGLVAVKVLGAAMTGWVFWRLRVHLLSLVLVCALAVLLLYTGSLNLLALLEALGGA